MPIPSAIDRPSFLSDAEVAVRAASAGAAVVEARYGGEARRVRGAGVDFTTEVDVESERAIRAVLSELRPGDGIVGEELGAEGPSTRRWLVDPICGTLNFAARLPLFAVNVALDVEGVTQAAAVVDPSAGEILWTDGARAWQRTFADAALVDVALAPTSSSRLVTVDLEARYPASIGTRLLSEETFRARFSPRCFSTTLALAWVASGRQAGYITGGALKGSVHWTAGIELCRAAGVVVTNLSGGPLHTGDEGLVAAADAETHELLLASLEALRQSGSGSGRSRAAASARS